MSNYVINLLSATSLYLIIKFSSWLGSLFYVNRTQGELTEFGVVFGLVLFVLFYVFLFTKLQDLFKLISSKIIK
ncbi:MAG: hypothetical protein GAK29_01470 [Acinetobacter bereziniae]|uniref:Uncharacterized protein n=1 Tax=Acinetobacter bereziniae TaxID=106648 RepID=A0A833PFF3_ACIBZ|nr:MAG: hypothetical protein GAK29_01470 [Acinetobacter bereziniae]